MAERDNSQERLRRWRLVLGSAAEPGQNAQSGSAASGTGLSDRDAAIDQALGAVYETRPGTGRRTAGLGGSAPSVHRWLGDIRTYFPTPVVQVLQRDALQRLGLRQMLLEPELLATIEPDINLAGTLLALHKAMPEKTRATARIVVGQVVAEIEQRLAAELQRSVLGALDRAAASRRPKLADVDW